MIQKKGAKMMIFVFGRIANNLVNRENTYQHLLMFIHVDHLNSRPNCKILDSSKLQEFVDDNFQFHENGCEFSKRTENTGERRNCSMSNFSFSHSVFKRLVLQTSKNQGLFGTGLTLDQTTKF